MVAEISSGDIGSDTAKAEAAASYSESDRADQKSKSDADADSLATEACPTCWLFLLNQNIKI